MKLDPSKKSYEQDFGWVVHPDGETRGELELKLMNACYETEVISDA